MKKLRFLVAVLAGALFLLTTAPAHAACSNPAGNEAEIIYNDDYRVPQYCDGVSWISMGTVPVTNGLVAHWPLGDGSGTTAQDRVGSNDGTLTNGPAWVEGSLGGAVSFDGSDDYIAATSGPACATLPCTITG